MVKKTLLCCLVLTLACTTSLFAASRPAVAHASRIIRGTGTHLRVPATQHKIFSNVGPEANEYQANGYFVAGPTNPVLGVSQFMSVPFSSSVARMLTLVEVPMQWYGQGHNVAQLCLYSDNSGVPGTQIGNCVTHRNLVAFGTTDTLTTYNFTSQALALGAGTPYWIVGQTPSTGAEADATMVWCSESSIEAGNVANGGWFTFAPDLESVVAIFGQ